MEDEDVQKCNKGDAIEHYTENQEAPSGTEVLKSDERNPSEIEKRLKGVEEILAKLVESDAKVHDTMNKGDDFEGEPPEQKATSEDTDGKREPMPVEKGEEEEKKEEEMEDKEEVQKATPVEEVVEKALVEEPVADIITKAQMDTFTKAINDELTLIKARIEKMETETIQKGGIIAIIPEQAGELSSSERNANVFGV